MHGFNGPTEEFIACRDNANRVIKKTGDNPSTSAGDGQDSRAPLTIYSDSLMSSRSPSPTSSALLISPRTPLPEWKRTKPFI